MEEDFDSRINAIYSALHSISRDVRGLQRGKLTDLVRNALLELVAAEDMCQDNFRLWPRSSNPGSYDSVPECKEHWSKAMLRKDAAVHKLLQIGRITRPKKTKPTE